MTYTDFEKAVLDLNERQTAALEQIAAKLTELAEVAIGETGIKLDEPVIVEVEKGLLSKL